MSAGEPGQPTPASNPATNSPTNSTTHREHIPLDISGEVLIVDDMSPIRVMLARHVEQMGHTVTQAANGREALEFLNSKKFDLVLLDVMMPEMDGYAVLDYIKSDEVLREIPVVMVSGVDEFKTVVRCIRRGAL